MNLYFKIKHKIIYYHKTVSSASALQIFSILLSHIFICIQPHDPGQVVTLCFRYIYRKEKNCSQIKLKRYLLSGCLVDTTQRFILTPLSATSTLVLMKVY